MWASEKGHDVVFKVLLKVGVNIETASNYGQTALMFGSDKSHEGIAKIMTILGHIRR